MSKIVCMMAILLFQDSELEQRIGDRFKGVEGTFAVAFFDLQTGRQVLLREREVFHAASTMKTPVMFEVVRRSVDGEIGLDDSVDVRNEFRSIVDGSKFNLDLKDDSDDSLYGMIGERMTVRSLMYHMITVSSNLATNILIELADAKRVTRTMRAIGADSMVVLRGVEDLKAFDAGLNNTTTAYDLMILFKTIAEGGVVGRTACEEMIDILDDQKFNDLIPAGLPRGTRVAHKTGTIDGVAHDGGIVFLPDGRKYVLVLLSKGLADREAGTKAVADVSRMIYESMK